MARCGKISGKWVLSYSEKCLEYMHDQRELLFLHDDIIALSKLVSATNADQVGIPSSNHCFTCTTDVF